MSPSRKVIAAVGLLVLGAAIMIAVVLLRAQGLDRAGQWVTVVGFFVSTVLGVAGLVLGWLTWRQSKKPVSASPPSGQAVDNVTAAGIIQVSDVEGNVRMGTKAPSSAAGPVVPAPPGLMSSPVLSQGQSVINSQVEGAIRQVRGVGGDVEIDR